MLKLYKLAIFTKLIQKLSVSKSAKASLKVLFLIFFLIFFLHFQTCIIFYLAQIEKVWIPNCDFIYKAMLFSISDMLAATAAELAFNAIMMVLSNVFGLMASFVSQMNEKDQKFSQQMDIVNTAISNLHLSEELKREIAYYMVQMQGTQEQQEEFQSFIEDIRPGLKKQIQREIFMIAIKKNELMQIMFSTKPQYLKMLEHIVDNLEVTMREPENEIIKQGSDECEFMYFVQKGKCNVVVQDKIGLDSGSKRVRQLYPGDHFGVSNSCLNLIQSKEDKILQSNSNYHKLLFLFYSLEKKSIVDNQFISLKNIQLKTSQLILICHLIQQSNNDK